MSARELLLKDVPIMPERFIEKIYIMWQHEKNEETGSELEKIIGEDEFNRILEECEDEKNIHGPYSSAADLIRDALED
jgi:hypothetical protein